MRSPSAVRKPMCAVLDLPTSVRTLWTLALFPLLCASPLVAQGPDAPPAEIVAEIARLDSIWLNAYVTADVEAVRPILANDFEGQIFQTILDKDEVLERVATSSGVEAMLLDHRVINVYGDVAVVHARRSSVSRDGGQRVRSRFVYTDVYVWRDGRWQCITGQSAPVPDEARVPEGG